MYEVDGELMACAFGEFISFGSLFAGDEVGLAEGGHGELKFAIDDLAAFKWEVSGVRIFPILSRGGVKVVNYGGLRDEGFGIIVNYLVARGILSAVGVEIENEIPGEVGKWGRGVVFTITHDIGGGVSMKLFSQITRLPSSLSRTWPVIWTFPPRTARLSTRVTLLFLTGGLTFSLKKYLLIPFVIRISDSDLARPYPARLLGPVAWGMKPRIANESGPWPLSRSTRNSTVRPSFNSKVSEVFLLLTK